MFFNPAQSNNQVSALWLVNPDDADAGVTISGADDGVDTRVRKIRLSVPAVHLGG